MTSTNYRVTGMSCGHCEAAIREEVGKIVGVERVDADAATGALVVISSAPVDDSPVLAAVEEAGYEAVPA